MIKARWQWMCLVGGTVAAMALWGGTARAQLEWDIGAAQANGSGCNNDNTTIIPISEELLAVVLPNVGVDLPSGPGTGLKNCMVAIPVTVPAGVGVSELDQAVLWWYAKGPGSTGEISVTSRFCEARADPINVTLSSGLQGAQQTMSTSQTPNLLAPRSNATTCLFRANFTVGATGGQGPISIHGNVATFGFLAYYP